MRTRVAQAVLQTACEFRILGPLEVEARPARSSCGGLKQRAVLALLLLDAGHVVSTDRLVDALWGERRRATAATSLQNYVSQLRKLLGAETLVTRPPGLRPPRRPRADRSRPLRAARAEARGSRPEQRAAALREALELWRGEPLADFALRAVRARPRSRGSRSSGFRRSRSGSTPSSTSGGHARARRRARGARRRASAAGAAARSADARALPLRVGRPRRSRLPGRRRALVEELGIEPGPALQRLNGSILRQESSLEPVGAARRRRITWPRWSRRSSRAGSCPCSARTSVSSRRPSPRHFAYPGGRAELTRVSQYVAVMKGSGPLYDQLHTLIETAAQPTPIHRFFASLPPLLRERGAPHQLIVTTSYDLALEQALLDAGEEFDVVSYIASGRHRGRFCHLAPDGTAAPIEIPNTYATELSLDRRTIILKLHGRFDPSPAREWESFVVTEDDYIEYLARADSSTAVPVGARGEAPAQPLPLPRLHDGRLEPAGRAQPALGRRPAQLPLVGGAARGETARAGVLAPARRRRARGALDDYVELSRGYAASTPRADPRAPRAAPAEPVQGSSVVRRLRLDALLFFGRERDGEIIVANLLASRLTVLYGASGVGKSSLLRASVARRLRREPDAVVIVLAAWTGDASPVRARAGGRRAGKRRT